MPDKKLVLRLERDHDRFNSAPSDESMILTVNHAAELIVKDTEKVRFYDLNEIKYDVKSQRLTITTGVPISVTVHAHPLDIEIRAHATDAGI